MKKPAAPTLLTSSTAQQISVGIGTLFRSIIGDSNALWKVTRKLGEATWEATVQDEPVVINGKQYPGDYTGNVKAFRAQDIAQILALQNYLDTTAATQKQWFAKLQPGNIVHYEASRTSWVRCQVVTENNETTLLPIALVGEWRSGDLPQRLANGTIYYGYNAQQIQDRKTFKPNASLIYEFNRTQPTNKQPCNWSQTDPRGLPTINIELPPMRPTEKTTAQAWQQIEKLREALKKQTDDTPDTILQRVRALL